MEMLREKLEQQDRFLVGVELVSIRGSMAERTAIKARDFAGELVACPKIDWISITDNAGGNPQLAPQALGKPILYAGKDVVIHLTCKDANRNGLESEAWLLHSEGFHNILAMTGDYPVAGNEGLAKPVFDLDSVGLISMLEAMNQGLNPLDQRPRARTERLEKTEFLIGAVTTNYKLLEGELVPQYAKLEKKIQGGARFIINQVGFDSRKAAELRLFMDQRGLRETPLIGNVYLLNGRVARLFSTGRIPGIVLTPALLELCDKQAAGPDAGRAFFQEFAAKQVAIYRGLGYRGAYLGGVHSMEITNRILEIEKTFAPDDWKQFAKEILFSQPGEFFYYGEDPATGLADVAAPLDNLPVTTSPHAGLLYHLSKWSHDVMFSPGRPLARLGARLCSRAADPLQGPKPLRPLERASKSLLFECKDCGDCSLPEIAFLCPESQCAKNQRNGPCGGTHGGRCEVQGYGDCIWVRAYDRLKADGKEADLLSHAPVIQNQGLRGTSAWANYWLGRDHVTRPLNNKIKAPHQTFTASKPAKQLS
jgi:methylenetetrahydrofolate reductase (NADPH)